MNHDAESDSTLPRENAVLRATAQARALQIGELLSMIAAQQAQLKACALLHARSIELLNQLALLTRDDESYLWQIGGRPLDDAYKALKQAVKEAEEAAEEAAAPQPFGDADGRWEPIPPHEGD